MNVKRIVALLVAVTCLIGCFGCTGTETPAETGAQTTTGPSVSKAAMEKLKAEHDKKIADLEATYKKQAKASAAGQDANVTRIQITLESFKRDLTSVSAILGKMRAEGGEQAQKADKLQANVERILGGLISEAGWTL